MNTQALRSLLEEDGWSKIDGALYLVKLAPDPLGLTLLEDLLTYFIPVTEKWENDVWP